MTTIPISCYGCGEIGCATMNVKHHVTHTTSYDRNRVYGTIMLYHGLCSVGGWVSLGLVYPFTLCLKSTFRYVVPVVGLVHPS